MSAVRLALTLNVAPVCSKSPLVLMLALPATAMLPVWPRSAWVRVLISRPESRAPAPLALVNKEEALVNTMKIGAAYARIHWAAGIFDG